MKGEATDCPRYARIASGLSIEVTVFVVKVSNVHSLLICIFTLAIAIFMTLVRFPVIVSRAPSCAYIPACIPLQPVSVQPYLCIHALVKFRATSTALRIILPIPAL